MVEVSQATLSGLVQNVCPNAASVIELKTSWESVLFLFGHRLRFFVVAWPGEKVLFCTVCTCTVLRGLIPATADPKSSLSLLATNYSRLHFLNA